MVFSWDRKPLKRKYISVQNKSIRVKYERISPASSGDQDPVAVDAASGSLPKGISTTGSEQVDKQSEEAVFFSDSQTNSSPAVDEVKKKYVSQVRQIFNDCWAKATGNSKVPYKSIKDNLYQVEIKNLPNGVKFRDPSSMGLSTLKEIISARDSLEFSVTRTNKVATSTSLDEPCRLNQD